jgi:hypothetical protein
VAWQDNVINLHKISKMKKTIIYLLSAFVLINFSCTSIHKTMSSVGVQDIKIQPLTPDQYEVMGQVEGYGEATRILFFGANFKSYSDLPGVEGKAAGKATYNAISQLEGADILIAPRYEVEKFDFLGIYAKARVKVKAKAVQIKSTR